MTRCGRIALLGLPNAGKSTLMNRLVGQKLAIISPKAQTTRTSVLGVLTREQAQYIFIDAPGVFEATKPYEKSLVKTAWKAVSSADCVLFLQDGRKQPNEETESILARLLKQQKPVIIGLNKIDALRDKPLLLARAAWFQARAGGAPILMISAKHGDGLEDLLKNLAEILPKAPWSYDADTLTDTPMRVLAAELTREQCFLQLHDELPYSLTVTTERYQTKRDGSVVIHQEIFVQNERQKTIVLGRKGSMLKTIGEKARKEISALLGAPCHLFLFVKVRADWKEKIR